MPVQMDCAFIIISPFCYRVMEQHKFLIVPNTLISDGRLVKIIPRTMCKCTGLKCHGKDVYENDWLTSMGAGEKHSFLVVLYKNEYRAFEDEENSCDLANLFLNETCRITGNIYD